MIVFDKKLIYFLRLLSLCCLFHCLFCFSMCHIKLVAGFAKPNMGLVCFCFCCMEILYQFEALVSWDTTFVSLVGAATNIIFCHNKHVFVFCCDKSLLVVIKHLSYVVTSILLSRQNSSFFCDKNDT